MDPSDPTMRPLPHEWNDFFRKYYHLRESRNGLILDDSAEAASKFVSSQQLKMRIAKYLNETKRPVNRINPEGIYRRINYLLTLIHLDLLGLIYDYCPPGIVKKLDYFPTEMILSRKPLSKFLKTWKTREDEILTLNQWPSLGAEELKTFWQNSDPNKKELQHYLFVAVRTFSLLRKYYYLQTRESWKGYPTFKTKKRLLQLFRTLQPDISIARKNILLHFNPDQEWRVEVIQDKHLVRRLLAERDQNGSPLEVKKEWVVTLPLKTGPIQAIIRMRRKNPLQVIAKLWGDSRISDLAYVPDIHGIRLAYFTEADMHSGVDVMRNQTALISDTERKVAGLNPHSAKWLEIISQQATFLDKIWEIQHITAKQMYDIEYSAGQENHMLYHRRGYTEFPNGLFYQLFPPEIYGIEWADPSVCSQMDEHIIQQTIKCNKDRILGIEIEPKLGTVGTGGACKNS